MGVFRRKVPTHYVPVHPDNIGKNDWIILLEVGTIVGPTAGKLRVAKATLERKIVTKYNIFLRAKHFLVLDGYDPRIHTLYFCPQLYAYDSDHPSSPLEAVLEQRPTLARWWRQGRERTHFSWSVTAAQHDRRFSPPAHLFGSWRTP